MASFNDYWKKKAAKRKKGWAAKNERFATDHTTLEQIRSIVFQPIDYDKRGYDADAFVFSYFKTANPLIVWNQGVLSLSEPALRKALEEEGAEVQSFKMEVSKASIQGQEAPEPKITDYGRYKWGSSCTNKVFDFEKKYHAWLKHVYKVCAEMELITLNYREATMTIKRYTLPGLAFAYYEVNPCVQLMKSPLLMEETGFSVLNVAFLLMDMAAEWELRQEEFNYYAKNLKVRKMEAATADRIDPEQWKELSWKEKINEVKTFMEAVIERDCANEVLDIPFHTHNINMIDLLKRQMIPYFNSNGLQKVHAYIPSDSFHCIAMEYQGCRALLKYLNHKMWFYPFVNPEWSVNSEQSVEFKRLTISAIAEYLKQMPNL